MIGALCVACGFAIALVVPRCAGPPRDDSADAGFARDMATHHAQAVEMSFLVRDKSADAQLRTLAYDIIVTQDAQRGMFMGWLQAWGLPQSSVRARMAWMPAHAHGAAMPAGTVLMPGMASDEELSALREANGVEAEVLFLKLMIRHHEGGVVMARAVAGVSDRAEVVQTARSIEDSQRAEIGLMSQMLTARGASPLASLLE